MYSQTAIGDLISPAVALSGRRLGATPWPVIATSCICSLIAYVLSLITVSETASIVGAGLSLTLSGFAATLVMGGGATRRSLATLRLGTWFAAAFAVVFGVATVALALASGSEIDRLRHYVTAASAVAAVPVLSGFILAACLAYVGAPADWSSAISRAVTRFAGNERQSYGAPLALLTIGILAEVALFRSGILGYASDAASLVQTANPFTNILTRLGSLVTVVTFWMAWRWSATRKWPALLVCLASLAFGVAWGLASGTKEGVATPVLIAILGWSAHRLRVNWGALLLLGIVFIALIYPFVTHYRETISVGGDRLKPAEAVAALSQQSLRDDQDGVGQSIDSFTARIARLPDFAVIQSQTPQEIAYRPTSDLFTAPLVGVVPRAFWPDKPVQSTGYQFGIEYYGQVAGVYSSAAVTPEGDLYRHGGWLVVVLGGALMGVILRGTDDASDGSGDPRTYFLAVLLFVDSVKHELDFVGFVATIPSVVAVFFLALIVSRQRLS